MKGRIMMTSPGGQLIVAVCPGLAGTRVSRLWFTDMSAAQSPDQATAGIVRPATGPVAGGMYAELVQRVRTLPWREASEAAVETR
ncbi:MAG TPA: hypothetical protein VGD83_12485 [Streptosporangiaceae bacterium]|jgi:hypothetical protein